VNQRGFEYDAATNQLDAESCADIWQLGGAIRGAVVDDEFAAHPALEHAFDVERGLDLLPK
jgi:hypothetical protein